MDQGEDEYECNIFSVLPTVKNVRIHLLMWMHFGMNKVRALFLSLVFGFMQSLRGELLTVNWIIVGTGQQTHTE